MNRLIAAVIDTTIIIVLSSFSGIFLVGYISSKVASTMSVFCVGFVYYIMFDFLGNGISLGKKWANVKVDFINSKYSCRLLHSFLKVIGTILWPINICIYILFDYKMPYDKIIYSKVG